MKRLVAVLFSSILLSVLVTPSAHAGGGCGVSIPSTSSTFIKPGQSFHIDFSLIQYDSDINYADPKIAPQVNFSSSVAYLQERMTFSGLDSNNWAKYRATFQIPSNFVGNQNLQAVLIYPSCEGATRTITYGPQITIASDSSIPTCIIEDLQVDDYSVKIGEPFKVGFRIISPLTNLNPKIELTDSVSKRVIQTRLAGSSGTDVKIYEATISYTQAFQYNYGAIARAVVDGMCNSSGQRQAIGIYGHVTSMAMLQPIVKSAECISGSQPVSALDYLGKVEKLSCSNYPAGSSRYSWRSSDDLATELNPNSLTPDPCTKEGAMKTVSGQKFICADTGLVLNFLPATEAEKLIFAKKQISEVYVQSANLISRLKIAFPLAKSTQLKNLIQKTINDLSAIEPFYSSNRLNPFDFTGAKTEIEKYNAQTKAIISLIGKQRITITCVKGNLVKKVTAANPVCAKGYKKK